MDTFPDLGSLTDQELKDLIQQLTEEEMEISYKRRILHGKIDILRAELVNRLRKKHEGGEDVITGADVQQLTDILSGRVPRRPRTSRRAGSAGRPSWPCTAQSAASSTPRAPTTARGAARSSARRRGGRGADDGDVPHRRDRRDRAGRDRARSPRAGAALVIRAGGGRVGETFPLTGDRLCIGRRPDADVFLDDVTVSRDHALLVRRGDGYYLDDCGSLNGTYVNRRRDRVPPARRRRRAADRQVQAHVPER